MKEKQRNVGGVELEAVRVKFPRPHWRIKVIETGFVFEAGNFKGGESLEKLWQNVEDIARRRGEDWAFETLNAHLPYTEFEALRKARLAKKSAKPCTCDANAESVTQCERHGEQRAASETPKDRGLSFDGCGINGPDEYRSRIATFVNYDVAKQYGKLLAASPELLQMCKEAEQCLRNWAGIDPGACLTAHSPEAQAVELADEIAAAIAKADGKE